MEQKLNFLLDRTKPFNQERAQLLDQLTLAMNSTSPQAAEAHQIWKLLKEDEYFWYYSSHILKLSQVNETKVFTLVILEEAIKQKWLSLPKNQRDTIKQYIVDIVLEYGAINNISKPLHNILSKANSVLVQIVKYEWNTTWTSFINDICSASYKDMNLCENNFFILKMLSEQIFDFSKNQMTQKQISDLKQQMVNDFTTIYDLCKLVLQNLNQAKQSLVRACLQTLHAFLSWIPMAYIVYTDLIDKLIYIMQSEALRTYAMACLVEIAGLKLDPNSKDEITKYLLMLKNTTIELNRILPIATEKQEIQKMRVTIKRKWQIFEMLSNNITMFYSQFFKEQNAWIESAVEGNPEMIQVCRAGLNYMLMLMKLDDDQVFKICVEFFHYYIGNYLQKLNDGQYQNMGFHNYDKSLQSIYKPIFMEVMKTISLKMAKPEEVLIVIDEDGVPVREQIQNTENSSLYEVMKELASFLVKVDWPEMKKFILGEIENQQKDQYFSFEALNSLSWMVGSLWGSIIEKEEKNFFIASLRTLLHLCQSKKGKQNKAVIASCIMYVVGQYPTFLKNNWSFLKTVVKKLFEFMKQQFPGIMEMACNAFLKIVKSTADQFVILQMNDKEPFIKEIIQKIPDETHKLNNDTLKLVFYEAIGYLIGAEKNTNVQGQLIKDGLGSHLYEFHNIIQMAQTNTNVLLDDEVKRKILFFLRLNETFATGIGQPYQKFLQKITDVINKLYLFYSQQVNVAVQKQGRNALNFVVIKSMRSIKKQVIKIYVRYIQKCNDLNLNDAQSILNTFIFPLGILLSDFENCPADTKEQQFVALFTAVLSKLYMVLTPDFLSVLVDKIFRSSLPLITTDFNSFPEIRSNFFAFLKAIIKYNFTMLYSLDENKFNLILDCVVWSLRHELSTYSDLGLELLEDILTNVNTNNQIMNAFYPKYHIRLITDILDVMTDGFHKSGLQSQSRIFYLLIQVAKSNIVNSPIAPNQPAGQSNAEYLYYFFIQKLTMAFIHTSKSLTTEKVTAWFQQNNEAQFKQQIADYLVLINRYTVQEISENKK